jgi:uncharacterized protein YxeA
MKGMTETQTSMLIWIIIGVIAVALIVYGGFYFLYQTPLGGLG